MGNSVFQCAKICLDCADVAQKVAHTHFFVRQWRDGLLSMESVEAPQRIDEPGRPERPHLIDPAKVPRRNLKSDQGRQALVHAICHIEFNAINLAWDAVYRFRDMPREYYDDWLKVADEEAYHFALLRQRLQQLGCDYGDFNAHNGLWEMALKTDHDVLVRMALVPRVLEARGLDVTPGMIEKLRANNDLQTLRLLEIIFRDEIGHVAIGSRWFKFLCEQRGLDSEETFSQLLGQYMKGYIKQPIAEEPRKLAGFSDQELRHLLQQAK